MPFPFLIASSAALFFAHTSPHGYFFAIGGIALFLFSLRKDIPPRNALLYGLVLGTANTLGALYWLWDTLPLTWLGIESQLQSTLIIFLSWSITAVVLGIPVALWSVIVSVVRLSPFLRALCAASLFVLGEYAGMWLYAILTIGESYQPAAHFSLAMVGYTAADAPGALLLAPIGGVYALSFFIVFIASLMASAHSRKLLIFIALATYVLIGVWITSIGEDIKATEPAISVALVTTDFDPQIHTSEREQEEVRKRVAALVAESGDTDIVVLPEGLRFLQFGRRGGDNLITATATPKLLIDSSSDIEGVRRLELRLQNEDGSIERGPRKQFLLPYGEYLPVVFRALGLLVVGNDGVTAIEQNRTLMPGRFDVFGPLSPYSLGVRFCSESMSPELFRKETRAGAQILVNTANSSWFHHSATLERKMISIARVRAAESARYLAVANNQGPSLAINPLGRVIARSHSPEEVVQVRVATLTGMTPYVQFGSWILLLPLALVILSAVKISLARRKSDL